MGLKTEVSKESITQPHTQSNLVGDAWHCILWYELGSGPTSFFKRTE